MTGMQVSGKRVSGDLWQLDLSARPKNALSRAGIRFISELCSFTGDELLLIPEFGKVSLAEVTAAVDAAGLVLGGGPRQLVAGRLAETAFRWPGHWVEWEDLLGLRADAFPLWSDR